MMGEARKHVRCVSVMGKPRRCEGEQGALFSRLMLQCPLNQFREIAAAFRENRRSLRLIRSPIIDNEDVEKQTEGSPSDEHNGEIDEEQGSHYDAGESPLDKLIIKEVKKYRILWETQVKEYKDHSKEKECMERDMGNL